MHICICTPKYYGQIFNDTISETFHRQRLNHAGISLKNIPGKGNTHKISEAKVCSGNRKEGKAADQYE